MIETVRGHLDEETGSAIATFWEDAGVLSGAEAQARLPEVICIVRDDETRTVVGTSTATVEAAAPVGGQLFWLYRGLTSDDERYRDALVTATYHALAEDPGEGIGVLRLIADPDEIAARPQAVWDDPPFLFAGYLDDDRQLRVAYFDGARIRV